MTPSPFQMQGRSILVTGATGQLGQHMVYALAEAGAHVLVNGRSIDRVRSLVEQVLSAGGSAEALTFDVTNGEQIHEVFSERGDLPLHGIINNAYHGGSGNIETTQADNYRQSYEIAVVSAHEILRAALPALRAAVHRDGDASIINISTMYGMVSPDLRVYDSHELMNPPSYGAAKAALLQWTRYAACEFGPEKIRVNAISPGPFPSPKVHEEAPEFIERIASRVPLGRVGNAVEIRGPIVFLASSASTFVNGATLVVDGGWTAW